MPPQAEPTNGNGLKATLAWIGLAAAAASAVIIPQSQRIGALEKALESHVAVESHHGTVKALAELSERFKEVETQFRWFREAHDLRLKPIEAWQVRWTQRMEDSWAERGVTTAAK